MAKESRKRGQKLGEIVGRRRPVLGSVLIFAAFILIVSALSYAPSQNIFFKPWFSSFLPTTEIYGNNLCGAFGATFTLMALICFGAAAYTIPIYVFWTGLLLWRRRANGISKLELFSIFGGVLFFSILCASLQAGVEASGTQSAYWPLGWGGKFGTVVFDSLLRPFLDVFGSAALAGVLFLFCSIVVFVDSPKDAAKELAGAAKNSPSAFLRVGRFFYKCIAFFPSLCWRAVRRKGTVQTESAQTAQQPAQPVPQPAPAVQPAPQVRPTPEKLPKATRAEIAAATDIADGVLSGAEGFAEPAEHSSKIGGVFSDGKIKAPISDFSSRFDSDADEEDFTFVPSAQSAGAESAQSDGAENEPASVAFAPEERAILQEPQSAEESVAQPASAESFPQPAGADSPTQDAPEASEADDIAEAEVSEPSESATPAEPAAQADSGEIDLSHIPTPKPRQTPAAPQSATLRVEEAFKSEKYEPKPRPKTADGFVFPSTDLLDQTPSESASERENYEERMAEIVTTIANFGISVKPVKASSGPVITRYEVRPATGVRLNRIANLEDDIALGICAQKVRIVAPIPGQGTVGIEVPNKHRSMVRVREIIESREWNESRAEIPVALGKDITGVPIVLDLAKMPHALIAGSTGSGKSVCINSIILSLLFKMTPDDLRFIMVDPKVVEMQMYNSLPHMLIPVVTDPRKVPAALKWLTGEMMRRYRIFKETNVRNIAGFNAKIRKDEQAEEAARESDAAMTPEERTALADTENAEEPELFDGFEIPKKKLPYIVCIIDELADLMMVAGKEVEGSIARLTQLARAAGIHLIVATQRPSRDVITGLIKSNLPTRIAFKVASQIDSRTILDHKGAETLIGYGDMLYINNGSADMIRAQGAFMSDEEIGRVVEALKVNGEPQYAEEVQAEIERAGEDEDDAADGGEEGDDPMFAKAVALVKQNKKASTSFLQRKLGIGYPRASKIIDEMEERGMIGPDGGPGSPREIYM